MSTMSTIDEGPSTWEEKPDELHRVSWRTAPSDSCSDEELMAQYQKDGDRRAFDLLANRYKPEMLPYLRRYLGDAQLAEDAFQNTLLQVHLKCDRFEPGRRLRPWLYTVATNQAIDLQRRNKRHNMVSLDKDRSSDADDGYSPLKNILLQEEDDDVVEVVDALIKQEHAELINVLIEELSEIHQEVLRLVYFQGLKYREAADILEIPVGTVKSRLHVAIQKLSILVKEVMEFDENPKKKNHNQEQLVVMAA